MRRAVLAKADLTVAHKRDHHRLRALLAQTDWELLRSSPMPVLLVKGGRYRPRAPVLAAVDPLHANAKAVDLDKGILRNAALLAVALKAPIHAVQVSPAWATSEADPRVLMTALTRASRIKPARMHLLTGIPDLLLAKTARRLHAGVVVLGMMSRRGLKRFFLGNTAERLLDDLHCDLLIVKPRQFRSHIVRARRGIYYYSNLPMA